MAFVLGLIIFISGAGMPGSGQHKSFITAMDTGGFFFKTTDVYFKTNTQASQEDVYCVRDQKVKDQLAAAQASNKNVLISYETRLWISPVACGGSREVIEAVSE